MVLSITHWCFPHLWPRTYPRISSYTKLLWSSRYLRSQHTWIDYFYNIKDWPKEDTMTHILFIILELIQWLDGWISLSLFFSSFCRRSWSLYFFLPCLTSMLSFFSLFFYWLHVLPLRKRFGGSELDLTGGDFMDASPSLGICIDEMVIFAPINNKMHASHSMRLKI